MTATTDTRTDSVMAMADFVGVTRQTVYNWKQLADFPIDSDGSVSYLGLARWVCARYDSEELIRLDHYRRARADLNHRNEALTAALAETRLKSLVAILRETVVEIETGYIAGQFPAKTLTEAISAIESRITSWWGVEC